MPTKVWWEVPIDQEIEAIPERDYAPIFFPPEGAKAVFEFTESEFLKVLSALINGALVTYGDEWIQVVWYFLRSVDYPVSICELIIDCIQNDEDVQAILRAFVTNDETIQDNIENVSNRGLPINPTEATGTIVATDDYSALFGAITFLVDTIHGANLDLYEIMEAATNKRELGQILFEAIPLVETLPFDEASEYIDELASDIAEGYAAQWTTTPETGLRDRIRCGLFCLARDNGNSLSWDLIASYFWEQVGFTAGDYVDMMVDFVNFFLSGSWTGEEIVQISFANVASALSAGQKFSGLTFPGLTAIMELGLNDPDPDYETVCVECPPESDWIENDFSTGNMHSWAIYGGGTTFAHWRGDGWERGDDTTQIAIVKTISGEITDFEAYYNAPLDGSGGAFLLGSTALTGTVGGTTSDQQRIAWTGTAISGGAAIDLYRPGGYGGNQYLVRVRYKLTP